MTAAAEPDAWSVNRQAAEAVCRHAIDVDDARMLLELLGLVDEGGRALLPDDVQVITRELLAIPLSGATAARVLDEPSPRANTTPAGLANLPPASPAPRKDPIPMPTLEQEQTRAFLAALAPTPPAEAAASAPPAAAAAAPYIAALSVVELFVDASYQRPLDQPRVRRMTAAWDPRMLGILDVSDRGPGSAPRYAIVNGQHRWSAAGRVGVEYVACNVHEGLTVAAEAKLMYELDRSTKKLSGWDQWRARRAAGDPAVATVERIAAVHGLRVDDTGELRSYGTAEKLLKMGGEELLTSALAVLHAAYGATPAAFQAPLLMGVGQLIHREDRVDLDRLTRALAATRPEKLRLTATALREADGGSLHQLMTRAIVGQYNRTAAAVAVAR